MKRRGMTLIELMIGIVILSIVALAATRAMTATLHLTTAAERAQDESLRFDDATKRLRADVWSATAVSDAPRGIVLTLADRSQVVWTCATGELQRTQSTMTGNQESQRWQGVADGELQLRRDGPGARLIVSDRDAVLFVSQPILLRRMMP